MRAIVRKITDFMNTDQVRVAEERYLNGSLDRFDLEYRQRQIDRGVFRKVSHRSTGFGIN